MLGEVVFKYISYYRNKGCSQSSLPDETREIVFES